MPSLQAVKEIEDSRQSGSSGALPASRVPWYLLKHF